MTTATEIVYIGSGAAARLAGLDGWMPSRLAERGLIKPRARCGRFCLWSMQDIPLLREAAERAGYLPRADVPA